MPTTRHRLLAILLALCCVTAFATPAAAQTGGLPDLFGSADDAPSEFQTYDGNPSYIVEFENGSTAPTALSDWANSTDARTLVELDNGSNQAVVAAPRLQLVRRTIAGFEVPAVLSNPLTTRSYVTDVAPNYRIERVEPIQNALSESEHEPKTVNPLGISDPPFPTEGLAFGEDVNATALNVSREATGVDDTSGDGTGIEIAAIDTGTNVADPAGSIFGNGSASSTPRILNASKNVITNATVDTAAENYSAIADGNGHGTWVSAAIAANASGTAYDGMAPDADLLVVKALADDGSGSTADIVEGIRYSADQGVDIISMSLGSPLYSEPIADAVDYAYDQGVKAVVVAAGNSRPTRSPGIASPADSPEAIAVGATNGSQPGSAWSAYFSQVGPDSGLTDTSPVTTRGASVDVAAPGFQITAQVPTTGGRTVNETLSGTSMATPIVAGALAAAMDANGTLRTANHTTVHDAVRRTANPIPHAAEVEVGSGMVSAARLDNGTAPEQSQTDAMTTAAQQRNAYYVALGEPESILPFLRVGWAA